MSLYPRRTRPSQLVNPALALTVALLSARNADAAARFDVPIRCGARSDFDASIRARLGDEAHKLLDTLDLVIEPRGDAYRLSMRVGDDARTLEDPSCTDLLRAAVVVAIALWEAPSAQTATHRADGDAAPRAGEATGGIEGDLSAKPLQVSQVARTGGSLLGPVGHVTAHTASSERKGLPVQLSGLAGIGQGQQPDWTPFVGVRAAVELKVFGIVASLRFSPADRTTDANRRGVIVTALGGQVAAYWKPLFWAGIEAGLSTHYLHGAGVGSRDVWSADVVSAGPHLSVWAIPWQNDWIFTTVATESHLNLLRPRFEISGYGEVYRVSGLSWASYLSAGVRFR